MPETWRRLWPPYNVAELVRRNSGKKKFERTKPHLNSGHCHIDHGKTDADGASRKSFRRRVG